MKPISIESLRIKLGSALILPDVSFDVKAGECFGLVGESGSGKSTVLRCMSLLFNSWSGTIRIDGKSVREMSPFERC